METQRKLHDAFAGKTVAVRARRAAFDVAAEADAEIARLQASNKQMADALRGVIRVADRKTDEFDAARAALARYDA